MLSTSCISSRVACRRGHGETIRLQKRLYGRQNRSWPLSRASKPALIGGAFRAGQFRRDCNWLAHYETTGPEFWDQSGGQIDAFVDFLGSGATYAGVTRALKQRNPAIR